jgi:hypothetical protein
MVSILVNDAKEYVGAHFTGWLLCLDVTLQEG